MEVVFPDPFTPTIKITFGDSVTGKAPEPSSIIIAAISCSRTGNISAGFCKLFFRTVLRADSIKRLATVAPVSDKIKVASNSSKKSSSKAEDPRINPPSFSAKLRRLFSNPLFNESISPTHHSPLFHRFTIFQKLHRYQT